MTATATAPAKKTKAKGKASEAAETRIQEHDGKWLADEKERTILAALVNDPEVLEELAGIMDCNKLTPGHYSVSEAYRLTKFSFALEQAFQALREKAGLGKGG